MGHSNYQWRVLKVKEAQLEHRLNELDAEWEIFSVTPTIHFGTRLMGTPVPSEVLFTVIGRRPKPA